MRSSEDVLGFWLEEVGPDGWYEPPEGLDDTIRERFEETWTAAQAPGHIGWTATPRQLLALVILLDQFPRNMFRGSGRAFASDTAARAAAKRAIARGWDRRVPEPERQFFYLPLCHSECLEDQERCVRLIKDRMPETGAGNLLHARAHREVIRRFGRFPHRNADLGRRSTPAEQSFLAEGGYGSVVRALQARAA